MKISWLIQNRKKRRESPRVSLFPFLAVLICTMGALVLLLLTVTRQARLQAAKAAAAQDGQRAQAMQSDLEMVAWRVEQTKKARDETEKQLAEARLVLGHLEEHDRRLRQQLADLTEKRNRVGASMQIESARANNDAKTLGELEAQVAQAERNLAMAAQKASQQKHGYSIVPYNGPNQTRRRPIYIECTGDAVVIQPEGISFTEADFDGPQGPGNPLAAAVRAAREYMLLQTRGMPGAGEPYPLLLVRPTGIAAYEAAMSALQSWSSEFGYEFVNKDWNLAYPPPDPGLARAMNDAVAIARVEHDRLIAAAPSKYGKRPRPGAYRASGSDDGSGGDATSGNSAGNGSQSGASSPGFYASRPAGHGHGFGGDDDGAGSGNGSGNGGGAGNVYGRGASLTEHNPYATIGTPGAGGPNIGAVAYNGGGYPSGGAGGSGTVGYPGGSGGQGGGGQGGGYPGNSSAGGGYPGGGNGGGGFANGGSAQSGAGAGGTGNGATGSSGNGGSGASGDGQNTFASGGSAGGGPSGGSPNGQPGLPGFSTQLGSNGQPGSQASSQASSTAGSSGYGQSSGGQATGAANGPPPPTPEGYLAGRPNDGQQPPPANNVAGGQPLGPLRPGEYRPTDDTPPKKLTPEEEEKLKKDKRRLADKQDADWGLRSHAPRAAAISRPVQVDCYADRLVIVPEAGEGRPKVIALGPQSERTVDAMIVSIWQLIDVWGLAGSNMYWRPVLQFYVAPGAEPRLNEVVRMMDGSGLKIERKQ